MIDALGLPLTTQKAELNFNGCFCGATCPRLARDTVRAGESGAVLVVAMELALTHFEPVDTEVTTLVANGLFADGAAAIVMAPEGRWRFERAGMSIVPETRSYLTFAPPTMPDRQTYVMYLHREVGARLGSFFRHEGRPLLDALLEMAGPHHPEVDTTDTLVLHVEPEIGPAVERCRATAAALTTRSDGPTVIVATDGAVAARPTDTVNMGAAAVWGFVRTLRREQPSARWRLRDVTADSR